MTLVRGPHHPPLDAVDVLLRVLLHPALVAAVLGRVHGHQPRALEAPRELARRAGDQPVVGVHEVERDRVAERGAGRAHVVVHGVDPAHEGVEVVLRELRLAHAVDGHAVAVLDRLRGARRRAPARAPRRRCCTSPSASLRTWRANPPSTIGGYSQDRMRTRIDTPDGDVTGPKLACLHHLDPPYPGSRDGGAARRAARARHDRLGGDPLPDLGASTGSSRSAARESVTEIDRYPVLQSRRPRCSARRSSASCRCSASASAPSCSPTRSAAACGGCRGARSGGSSWSASPTTSCCRTRCGPCTGTRMRSSRRPAPSSCSTAAASAARRSGSAARGACSSTPTSTPPRSTAGTRATATGWQARAPTRPPPRAADAEHLPGQAATAEAIFGGFVRRARAARSPCAEVSSVTCVRRDSSRSAPVSTSRHAPASSSRQLQRRRPGASAPARRRAPRRRRARTRTTSSPASIGA